MIKRLHITKESIRGYLMRGKKKGDINYFLGILIVAVILIAVLAIAKPAWPALFSTAIKSIIDKAIAAVATGTGF